MIWQPPHVNLLTAWVWILAGFGSGTLLGLGFAREDWLGGYASMRRRLYRLAHISFFGLGGLNLLFYLTVHPAGNAAAGVLAGASWLFVAGALTMPVSCLWLAHHPRAKPHVLFAVPVGSLLAGGFITLWTLVQS